MPPGTARHRIALGVLCAVLLPAGPGAQSNVDRVAVRLQADLSREDGITAYVQTHQREMVSTLIDFAAIPNVKGDTANLQRNAEFARDLLAARGLDAELIATPAAPLVVASL